MKRFIGLIISLLLLSACKQSSNKAEPGEHVGQVQNEITVLSLNNGIKWKADSITNNNVSNLRDIVDNFREKSHPSRNDYQTLSTDLNSGLNKMIMQCKMTGLDHEALHRWLAPILKVNNELKNATDTTIAASTFESIGRRLGVYTNYFE